MVFSGIFMAPQNPTADLADDLRTPDETSVDIPEDVLPVEVGPPPASRDGATVWGRHLRCRPRDSATV